MTALETAASAVNDILSGKADGTIVIEAARKANLPLSTEIVRAVLASIRDLDHDATAAIVRPGDDRTLAVRDWQAVIDAILAEGGK